MKFVLEIDCDNAAFDEDPVPEVIRILAETVGKLADGGRSVVLVDSNGNSVGRAEFRGQAADDDDDDDDDEPAWGAFPEERGHHDLVGTPHAQAHAEVERRWREGGGT